MKTEKPIFPEVIPTSEASKRTVRLKADCEVPCYIAVAVLQSFTSGSCSSTDERQMRFYDEN